MSDNSENRIYYKQKLISYLKDENKRVLSISHIDMDGFCCSYLLKKVGCTEFINTNYGDIKSDIESYLQLPPDLGQDLICDNIMLIITDLNLNEEEFEFILKLKRVYGIDTILFDHHISGKKWNKEPWYNLDITISASKELYSFLLESNLFSEDDYLNVKQITDLTDIYDMWRKENNELMFKRASTISNFVFDTPFEHNEIKRKWIFELFSNVDLIVNNSSFVFETNYFKILYNFLLNNFNYDYINDDELSIFIKCALLHLSKMDDYKKFEIEIGDYKVVVFSDISTKVTQYTFDKMLLMDEYKNNVLINYNKIEGKLSIRSNNEKAVIVAKFFNGGGHSNASGAHIDPKDGLKKIYSILLKEKEKENMKS